MRKDIRFLLLATAVAASAGFGCKKSKEDQINAVCDKMHAEDVTNCAGQASCVSEADGKRDACRGLAKTVAESDGPPKTIADQVAEVSKKCDGGDLESCTTYGAALMLGKGVAKDEAKGFALVKKACDAGNGGGCEMMGRAYERGMGVAVDKTQMAASMEKACNLGTAAGCRAFAMSYAHSDAKRIPLLEKACDGKDAIGCMGLGAAYLNGGQGTDKDLAKAKSFLQKACDLEPDKMQNACDKAKTI